MEPPKKLTNSEKRAIRIPLVLKTLKERFEKAWVTRKSDVSPRIIGWVEPRELHEVMRKSRVEISRTHFAKMMRVLEAEGKIEAVQRGTRKKYRWNPPPEEWDAEMIAYKYKVFTDQKQRGDVLKAMKVLGWASQIAKREAITVSLYDLHDLMVLAGVIPEE